MFREMRRFRQSLPKEVCEDILKRRGTGVLAALGDEGYPYAVPVNFYYEDGRLYFHGAKTGHKIDAIAREEKVSFCVIDHDELVPAAYTTYFRSVIVFGRAHLVEDDAEKRLAVEKIGRKFAPEESEESLQAAIAREWAPLGVVRVDIEHISGKEAMELVRRREKNS